MTLKYQSAYRKIVISAVLTAVVVSPITFFITIGLNITSDTLQCYLSPLDASISITKPQHVSKVIWDPVGTEVLGESSGLRCDPGLRIYVLIHPVSTDDWWVQDEPIPQPGGSWRTIAHFGTETEGIGEEYELVAIVAENDTYSRGDKVPRPDLDSLVDSGLYKVTREEKSEKLGVFLTTPKEDDEVEWIYLASGRVTGLSERPDLNLYLLIYPEKSNGPWWIQNPPLIRSNGEWSSIVFFGRDPTIYPEDIQSHYRIVAIVTEEELEPGQTLKELPPYLEHYEVTGLIRS